VENIVGAAGKVGTSSVARSTPDGYTLLYLSLLQYVLNDLTDANLTYNAKEDLVPVSVVNFGPVILVASKNSGIKTVDDLFAKSKTDKGVFCGSPGAGGSSHIWCVNLVKSVGGKFTHVPFAGVGPQIPALLRGDIDFTFETYPTLKGLIEGNEVTPVAILSDRRLDKLPDVPAIGEVGYPAFASWKPYQVLMAPHGTPKAIVDRLSTIAQEVVAQKDIQDRLSEIGIQTVQKSTPEEAMKLMMSEFNNLSPIVESAGLLAK
jgi:tripartite-type tricarboxylate transporter receptor subunit TctC